MTAPKVVLSSMKDMTFGSPAFHAKLADSKLRLAEGYRDALTEKNRHTIKVLPPHLLPTSIRSCRPHVLAMSVPTTKAVEKRKKTLKVVLNRKKELPRALRLQNLGKGVNFNLPLHYYPPEQKLPKPKLPCQQQQCKPFPLGSQVPFTISKTATAPAPAPAPTPAALPKLSKLKIKYIEASTGLIKTRIRYLKASNVF